MIAGIFFTFWRIMEIITLIPTMGMLVRAFSVTGICVGTNMKGKAWFVHQFQKANQLTPNYVL